MIGRLRAGVARAQAQVDLSALAASRAQARPRDNLATTVPVAGKLAES
jgi:hypothetical protein